MRAFRTIRLSSNVFNVDANNKDKSLSDLAHTVFIRDHKIKEAVINCGEYSVCIKKSIYTGLFVMLKKDNKLIYTDIVKPTETIDALIAKSINANNTKPKMQPTIQQVSGR